MIDGCVLAHEGRHDAARPLLRRAVDDVEKTDFFWARADVHLMYAEALALAGEGAAAARAAAFGLELLEAKGDITGAGRARERLDTVGLAPA